MRALPAVALLLAVALSGCSGGDAPSPGAAQDQPTQEEAREEVEAALLSFQASLTDPGGDLRAIEGTFTMPTDADDAPARVEMLWEWGSNDVVRMEFTVEGPDGGAFAFYCTPDRLVLVYDGNAVETPAEQGDCLHPEDGTDPLSLGEELPGFDEDVTVHPDGSLSATYDDGLGTTGVLHVGPDGRLTGMDVESPEVSGTMTILYGERAPIEVPEADGPFLDGLGP